ncbi:hypothetical protein PPACK8108_LOCUS18421 [Phakopsora pachyrhizi]|uniref:Uncharacterized protein n=1 Tax=Phakopsora pachyrhizi TaxID=170000 RepID=A0AAV0BEF8_PHAPC|nr:hypothetical protein PPACK8108_LOCUS18421 [Phakopsora pachyrhizi]
MPTIHLDIISKDLNLNNDHQKHQTKDQPEQRQDECPIEQKYQKLTSTTANPNPKPEPEMRSCRAG